MIQIYTYLQRPSQLLSFTYPEFYRWWRSANSGEQKNAVSTTKKQEACSMKCKSPDDFQDYLRTKSVVDSAISQLLSFIAESKIQLQSDDDIRALLFLTYFHAGPE